MKTLYLLRHAKSSWEDKELSDFDRPLNDRGLKAAPFMGKLMATRYLIPDIILSSPARRAKDTAVLLKAAGDLDTSVAFEDRIYEASPGTLLAVISAIDDRFKSAMLVGHNPGMEGLIRYLTGRHEHMPTAALAVIDLEIESWSETAADCGKLRAVIRPKEEMARSSD